MLFDKQLMFADNLAHDGTPAVIRLGTPDKGKGEHVNVGVFGNGLAGITGVKLLTGPTSSPATEVLEVTKAAADFNDGVIFALPVGMDEYATIAVVGTTTAGTYTAGLLKDGQTNL